MMTIWLCSMLAYGGGEAVYRVERSADGDAGLSAPRLVEGRVDDVLRGGSIDPKRLVDDAGRRFAVTSEIWAAEEGGAITSAVTLRVSEDRQLTPAEIDHHMGAILDTDGWLAFEARRQARVAEELGVELPEDLREWQSHASPQELIEVSIAVRGRPSLELEPLRFDPLAEGPSFDPEGHELRAEQRRAYAEEAEELLAPLVSELEAAGAEHVATHPSLFWVTAMVTPEALAELEGRSDILTIHGDAEPVPLSNGGSELRHGLQVRLSLQHGWNGSAPSGMVQGASAMRVHVYDKFLDEDHPAWQQRLLNWFLWDANGEFWFEPPAGTSSQTNPVEKHGTGVVHNLLANAFEDPGTIPQNAPTRSGLAPWAEFRFFDPRGPGTGGASIVQVQNWMFDEGEYPDAFQYSYGHGVAKQCKQGANNGESFESVEAANDMYLNDVFVSVAAGNSGWNSCTVGVPGTAAGSFTAGATRDEFDSFREADMEHTSARGADDHGRPMINLVAPLNREIGGAYYNDTYWAPTGGGTSLASPMIAGVALDTKQMMVSTWGSAMANHVGNLYAVMMLNGDNAGYAPYAFFEHASTNPESDPYTGFGRVAHRTLTADGMDSPFAYAVHRSVLAHGGQKTITINGGQPVPSDADVLEAVLWWYEPNLECFSPYAGCTPPADITFQLCSALGCFDSNSTAPGPRRVVAPPGFGGITWWLEVTGANIPQSTDALYHDGLQERTIHVALMYEDTDRDDANGPTCSDEIDATCEACCFRPNVSCIPGECL